jgi:glucokinase
MSTLGIDIGGTKYSMAAFDEDTIVERHSEATDRQGGRDWMLHQITMVGLEWKRKYRFERCGIGFGGPVDYGTQRIAQSTHVGGWADFGLANYVRGVLGIPAIMDNDANVGALGERMYGAATDCEHCFYMTLSTGIGGGMIVGGNLYRGADSFAGEIGHLTVRPDGPECLCGAHGCLERHCCGLWLERDHGKSARELFQDTDFIGRYVVDLAMGLKACIMLLNPERIVIGGGISKAGDALFEPLRKELRRQVTPWSRARLDVVPAALGDDSVLFGSLALTNEL